MNKVSGSFYTFAPLFVNSFVIFVCVCLSAFKADKSLNWAFFFFFFSKLRIVEVFCGTFVVLSFLNVVSFYSNYILFTFALIANIGCLQRLLTKLHLGVK